MDLLADLDSRGLIHDSTDRDELAGRLGADPITAYCGFDPTSDSLHVGSLMSILALRRLQDAGHHPIALVGGATGMIGDPAGRSAERTLLDSETLAANIDGVRSVLTRFLDVDGAATLVDNAQWTTGVSLIDFLRDVGKHFTVNAMVAKESVRSRMEGTEGLSYTEFSYMLLQAHDYLWLHDHHRCQLQVGGSDQWGNIVAGVDLVRRVRGERVHAYTWPLLTDAQGRKFGKTAEGTSVWLSADRTSPYRLFQYCVNQPDAAVDRLLRWMTLMPVGDVAATMAGHERAPQLRGAQLTLAREVTTLVHGAPASQSAEEAASVVFGGDMSAVGEDAFRLLESELPIGHLSAGIVLTGADPIEVAVQSGLAASKGAARRAIEQGGMYVNNQRIEATATIGADHLRYGRWILLRQGKKQHRLIVVEGA
ncbi:MAG TPA: tyrosine--tRNA ligase [Acidimicrobiales bacterium]|jgi:tyrosyl-tRNA synthetase